MNILVAGKGFIGQKIGEKLKEEHEVKYLDRSDADFEHDVTEEFDIEEEFDVVYHTIGLAPGFFEKEQYRQVHVEGTRNIVDAVEADKIIYISALNAGEVEHSFMQTKKQAEEIIEDSEMNYTIVRPSTVYGKGNKLLDMMRKTAPTRLFPDIKTETQPILREDLIDLFVEVAEGHENDVINAAGPEKISVGRMAGKIYAEEGYNCILVPYPQFLLEWKLVGLSFLPPPFQKENVQLLRAGNTTERNDAEEIIELNQIF